MSAIIRAFYARLLEDFKNAVRRSLVPSRHREGVVTWGLGTRLSATVFRLDQTAFKSWRPGRVSEGPSLSFSGARGPEHNLINCGGAPCLVPRNKLCTLGKGPTLIGFMSRFRRRRGGGRVSDPTQKIL
jgi:hypothetical protein